MIVPIFVLASLALSPLDASADGPPAPPQVADADTLLSPLPRPAAESDPAGLDPVAALPRLDADIAVDGVLDEAVWGEAARLDGFSQYEPVDGRPAAQPTEVLVWYSPTAIHFGVIAHDALPDAIRATRAARDNIGGDDHVILFLDTYLDRRRAFVFGVNPLGIQMDGIRSEGGGGGGPGGGTDRSPDFFFESAAQVTEEGWVAEVRIPFSSLRLSGTGPQEWGFNVQRITQRTGYTDTWADTRRASASFLRQSGTLTGLRDLDLGVVFEAQPFITASLPGAADAGGGPFRRGSLDPDAGANVRVGFTNVSLDATINPDFSQVEADEGQITVNERFALSLSEKRPFFLEGNEFFSTPNRLVYTRQVASPLVAGKITGKRGSMGGGYLVALDEGFDGQDAVFNIARLRRDFGASSHAGVLLTDRTETGGSGVYNRVAAADLRHVFGGMYYAEVQAGASWTRDEEGERAGPIWRTAVDRTGRSWGFNYSFNGISEDFRTHAGFVPRQDQVAFRGINRLTWYGEQGSLVEVVEGRFGPDRVWRHGGFGSDGALEGGEDINASVRFRGGWEISGEIGREFVELDPADFASYTTEIPDGPDEVYLPLGRVSGPSFRVELETPSLQGWDASVSARRTTQAIFLEGSKGRTTSLEGSLGLRPTAGVRIAVDATWQELTRARDGSRFARTVIPRVRLELQPTAALLFRAVAEYQDGERDILRDARTGAPLALAGVPFERDDEGEMRVDFLVSYRPTPGTVAFLGYGAGLSGPSGFAASSMERNTDGFFLKLAYQIRR